MNDRSCRAYPNLGGAVRNRTHAAGLSIAAERAQQRIPFLSARRLEHVDRAVRVDRQIGNGSVDRERNGLRRPAATPAQEPLVRLVEDDNTAVCLDVERRPTDRR